MKIPPDYTETQVIDILYAVSRRVARKFTFSYLDFDDIVQEGVIEGIKSLEKYDYSRPLENYLYICIRNGLFNFKRKNYTRIDKPCDKCPFNAYIRKEDKCTKYEKKSDCDLYTAWTQRNTAKQNIMDTLNYEVVRTDGESNMFYESELNELTYGRELMVFLEEELPVEFLADFQRLKLGITVPKNRREKLMAKIYELLEESKNL